MKKLLIGLLFFAVYVNAEQVEMTQEVCDTQSLKAFDLRKQGDKDNSEAMLLKLCDEGCGRACSGLMKADDKRGCEAKIPYGYSCYNLSYFEKDEVKKLELKVKGCKLGYTMGCDFLASDFAEEKNWPNALKYYNKGCDLGDDQSCGQLGMVYARGDYGEKSPEKAYQYWSKSVKLNPNNTASKNNLERLCGYHPEVCKQ